MELLKLCKSILSLLLVFGFLTVFTVGCGPSAEDDPVDLNQNGSLTDDEDQGGEADDQGGEETEDNKGEADLDDEVNDEGEIEAEEDQVEEEINDTDDTLE